MGRVARLSIGLALALAGTPAAAQQLAVRHYGVSDGLPQSYISIIHRDVHGFLWVGATGRLARFDGDRFVHYGRKDGVPSATVLWLADDNEGRLWLSTNGAGLLRLRDTDGTGPAFETLTLEGGEDLLSFLFDGDGTAWCVTASGLWRGRPTAEGVLRLAAVHRSHLPGQKALKTSVRGGDATLWFGVGDDVVSVAGGAVTVFAPAAADRGHAITALLPDGDRVLVAFDHALRELWPQAPESGRWKETAVDLGGTQALGPMALSGGRLMVATDGGLLEAGGSAQRMLTHANGLPSNVVNGMVLDARGAFWLGTSNGLARLWPGVESLTEREGLPPKATWRLVEAKDGRIYGTTEGGLIELGESRARLVPGSDRPPFDFIRRMIVQDTSGGWWIGTPEGIHFVPGPGLDLRRARLLAPDEGVPRGLFQQQPYTRALFADADGSVWVALTGRRVIRLPPRTNARQQFEAQELPAGDDPSPVTAFLRDRSGALWALGRMTLFRQAASSWSRVATPWSETVPSAPILEDSRRRLWIGTTSGPFVTTPGAATPRFERPASEALADAIVWCIAEDAGGRLYFGTDSGVHRLDARGERTRLLTSEHGLANETVLHCLSDRRGRVWVATRQGVTRIDPSRESHDDPPAPVLIEALRAGGEDVALSSRGGAPHLELGPDRNSVEVEFVAPSLENAGELRYQTMIEGDAHGWSAPARDRTLRFARLAPGRYRLLARAVTAEGTPSPSAATLSFEVRAPVWQRWWFQLLVLAAVGGAVFLVQRLRRARVRAVEQVRRQVSRDLHDEVGSGLGSIGILASVAADAAVDERERQTLAGQIAQSAAELGASLSDIVWFLRPGPPSLQRLAYRLVDRARALFPSDEPRFEARLPQAWESDALPLDIGRSVYLIVLEALHNAARHARARHVVLELQREDARWRLTVTDDGRGLPAVADGAGHSSGLGLDSMRARAEAIAADLEWSPRPDGGTVVTLRLRSGT